MLHHEFTWLRAAVNHTLPGTYAPGSKVDDLVRDLEVLPHSRPETPGQQHREFPQDIVAQLYPSADMHIPEQDALVRIEGLTHDSARAAVRSNMLIVGSHAVVAAPDGAKAHGQALAIVVGRAVDTSCRKGSLLMISTMTSNVWVFQIGEALRTRHIVVLMGLDLSMVTFSEHMSESRFRQRLGMAMHIPNFGLVLLAALTPPLRACLG